MTMLAEDPRTVFLGQSVRYPGTAMFKTLEGVPMEKRIEMPVAEQMQAGIAHGMALAGLIPVCIFPRYDFMLLAASQIVSHLDKFPAGVIIRVGVGSKTPLDPGPQHVGNYRKAFNRMCDRIGFLDLDKPSIVVSYYEAARNWARNGQPTILTEYMELYE